MSKIGISTDCMCDLPAAYLETHGVDVMQFYIHTSTGRFRNESEITSENILEYLAMGNVIVKPNVPEPEECKVYFEELLMRTLLDYLSVREDYNIVRVLYGGESVGDYQHRADVHHFLERILNENFRFRVDVCRCFVKHHDLRLMYYSSRE